MKTKLLKISAILLMLIFVFSACAPVDTPDADDTTNIEESTEAITTEEIVETTEDTADEVYIERADKEIKNILMIGNSFCFYYVEELYGIASADGYDLTVANLYESGCPVSDHWLWLLGNKSMYQFFVTNKTGRKEITDVKTSKAALAYADWDVITLQQHFYPALADDYKNALAMTQNYSKKLFDYMKENHSNALLFWQQTWAYEVGYGVADRQASRLSRRGGVRPHPNL